MTCLRRSWVWNCCKFILRCRYFVVFYYGTQINLNASNDLLCHLHKVLSNAKRFASDRINITIHLATIEPQHRFTVFFWFLRVFLGKKKSTYNNVILFLFRVRIVIDFQSKSRIFRHKTLFCCKNTIALVGAAWKTIKRDSAKLLFLLNVLIFGSWDVGIYAT